MRLIDAEAFDKFLENAEIEAKHMKKYVFASALNVIRGNLREFPTAEPVVRCNDCMFRNTYKFPPKYEERDYCDENMRSVEANDFCRWGIERSRQ